VGWLAEELICPLEELGGAERSGRGREKAMAEGRALQLLYTDDQGRFRLGKEAVQVLRRVQAPVSVVAVCGRARQGKSFLLNALAGSGGGTGFRVESTQRPCTKGLWLWSAPIERPDGSCTLLLDSEGIDSVDQTGQYSVQIFSLAVLLSSTFVFNQMGGIDEVALDRLSLVTEMTKHIHARSTSSQPSDSSSARRELGKLSPFLLWLLRDFYLELNEDGRSISPSEYLERSLSPVNSSTDAGKSKNEIRQFIKDLFPQRDCFTLVRPVNEESSLRSLDQLPSSDMRKEFRNGLNALTNLIFDRTEPKRVGGDVLSGPALASLAESYVDTINKGAVPTVMSAWQGVAEAECRRAAEEAESTYAQAFDPDSLQADEKKLDAAHSACLATAKNVFHNAAVGGESVKQEHEGKLERTLNAKFIEVKRRKLAEAERAIAKAFKDARENLESSAAAEGVSATSVAREAERQLMSLCDNTTGPTKITSVLDFAKEALRKLADVAEDHKQKADEETKAEQNERAEAQKRETQMKHDKERHEARARDAEDRAQSLEQEKRAEGSEKKARQAEKAQLQQSLEKTKEQAQAEKSAKDSVKQQLDDTKERLAKAEQSLQSSENRISSLDDDKKSAEQHLQTEKSRADRAEGELKRAQAERDASKGRISALEQKVQEKSDEMLRVNAKIDELQKELDEAHRALEEKKEQVESITRERDEAQENEQRWKKELEQFNEELEQEVDANGSTHKRQRRETGAEEPQTPVGNELAVSDPVADTPPPERMTVPELKKVLTEKGCIEDIHQLQTPQKGKPTAKKADFIELYKRKVLGEK